MGIGGGEGRSWGRVLWKAVQRSPDQLDALLPGQTHARPSCRRPAAHLKAEQAAAMVGQPRLELQKLRLSRRRQLTHAAAPRLAAGGSRQWVGVGDVVGGDGGRDVLWWAWG